jgi:hypothetical protein
MDAHTRARQPAVIRDQMLMRRFIMVTCRPIARAAIPAVMEPRADEDVPVRTCGNHRSHGSAFHFARHPRQIRGARKRRSARDQF